MPKSKKKKKKLKSREYLTLDENDPRVSVLNDGTLLVDKYIPISDDEVIYRNGMTFGEIKAIKVNGQNWAEIFKEWDASSGVNAAARQKKASE